jgi:erythronate-4-phosphate dehydrogenase
VKKIRIIADDKIPFLKGAFEEAANISYYPGNAITPDIVRDADALIIRTRTVCNRELLEGSAVKFIASATIGFDHIDTDWCDANNIRWTNAPGCNAGSVEQYIVSALLNWTLSGKLKPEQAVIGIVGVGNVGSKVAGIAKALGMKVLLNDPPRARKEGGEGFVGLDVICREADIITFHVPLNREGEDRTFHLAANDFFNSLEKKILLINSSRGEVVETEALKNALTSKQIKAACLDVWENEPDISSGLLDLVDYATPHIAGYSVDGKANGTMMSVRAVSEFFGLGLELWVPSELPLPENPSIIIDCTGMDEKEILGEVYLTTYDLITDDERLRKEYTKFEHLRGNYPVRREPPAFSVKLINNEWDNLPVLLEALRFSVLETSCFC